MIQNRQQLGFIFLNFLFVAGIVSGSCGITSIFLKRYGIEFLPLMFIVASLTIIPLGIVYTFLAEKIPAGHLLVLIVVFNTVCISAIWKMVLAGVEWVYPAGYVFLEVYAFLVFTHLWNTALKYIDIRQSRKILPLVAAAGSLGGLIGGFLLSPIVARMGTQGTFILWIGILLASLPIIGLFIQQEAEGSYPAPRLRRDRKTKYGLIKRIVFKYSVIVGNRFILLLAVTTFVGTLAVYLLDYEVNLLLDLKFEGEDKLTVFLGTLTGLSFILTFLIQVYALNRIVDYLGVPTTQLIFPGSMVMATGLITLSPGLLSLSAGFFTRRYMKQSFGTVLFDLLLNATDPNQRSKVRVFLKSFIVPIGVISASVLITLISKSGLAITGSLALIISIGYFGLAIVIKKEYVVSLLNILSSGRLNVREAMNFHSLFIRQETDYDVLAKALRESDDNTMVMLLDLIVEEKLLDERIRLLLKDIYLQKSDLVKKEIIRCFAKSETLEEDGEFFIENYHNESIELKEYILEQLSNWSSDKIFLFALEQLEREVENHIRIKLLRLLVSSGDFYCFYKCYEIIRELFEREDQLESGLEIVRNSDSHFFIEKLLEFFRKTKDPRRRKLILQTVLQMEREGDTLFQNEYFSIFINEYRHSETQQEIEIRNILMGLLVKTRYDEAIPFIMEEFQTLPFWLKREFLEKYSDRPSISKYLLELIRDNSQNGGSLEPLLTALCKISTNSEIVNQLQKEIGDQSLSARIILRLKESTKRFDNEDVELLLFSLDQMLQVRLEIIVRLGLLEQGNYDEADYVIEKIKARKIEEKSQIIETLENLLSRETFELWKAIFDGQLEQNEVFDENKFVDNLVELGDSWTVAVTIYLGKRIEELRRISKTLRKRIRGNRKFQSDRYVQEALSIVGEAA